MTAFTKLSRFARNLLNDAGEIVGFTSKLEELDTDETDTSLVPHPDGTGGVVWGADEGGGGGGEGASGLLARTVYEPGSDTTLSNTTSTTSVDADATNLAATFVVPPSGEVFVSFEALMQSPGSGGNRSYWQVREGSTDLAEAWIDAHAHSHRRSARFYLSGLTPGDEITLKWGHRVSGGAEPSYIFAGPSYGPAIIEVWDAAPGPTQIMQAIVGQMKAATWGEAAGFSYNKVAFDTSVTAQGMTVDLTNDRLTALIPGWYFVRGQAGVAGNGNIFMEIRKNGSAVPLGSKSTPDSEDFFLGGNTSTLVYLEVGDYVELFAGWQGSGGVENVGLEAIAFVTVAEALPSAYDEVATDEQRASGSTAFADLTTAGPEVTITVNTKVRVTIGANCYASGAGTPVMGFAMSGANSYSPDLGQRVFAPWVTGTDHLADGSKVVILEGLTPGSTTFTAKYAHYPSGITANFRSRSIFVERLD